MNKQKRLLCITLAIAMVVSSSVTAFASSEAGNPYNLTVLEDDESQKVVRTSDDNYIYITTHNKADNTMQVTTVDKVTHVSVEGAEVCGEDFIVSGPQARASIYENTFTNYEYTKVYGNPNEWELRRPDGSLLGTYYFKTYEVAANQNYLTAFKSAVDTINTKEGEIITAYGLVILADIAAAAVSAGAIATGGVLTPAAWASILTAAGANTAYIAVVVAWNNACKTAYDKYFETYTKSPTIFY